ncbi:MAG: hypothetical protein FJW31_03640 [Acidobacteria bacterium]|nr:hypothetical protein [Acidobacteriota bacterium]
MRPTLTRLLEAGVCVTHDEFRGRQPIVRSGPEIPSSPADWVNPAGRGRVEHSTSGSTGKRFTTMIGTGFLRYREAYEILNAREWGMFNRPRVLVSSVLPSIWPIRCLIAWRRPACPFRSGSRSAPAGKPRTTVS